MPYFQPTVLGDRKGGDGVVAAIGCVDEAPVGMDAYLRTTGKLLGLFLGIVAAAVATYGAFMSLKESGVGLPSADDFKSIGGSGGGDDAPPPPPPPA